jgi:hypothetical protein
MRDGQVGHAGQANRAVLGPDAMFPASAPTGPYTERRRAGSGAGDGAEGWNVYEDELRG